MGTIISSILDRQENTFFCLHDFLSSRRDVSFQFVGWNPAAPSNGNQPDRYMIEGTGRLGLSKPCMLQAAGGLELCSEPLKNVTEALHPTARLAAPRQLVVLAGEAHEPHLAPHLLQGRKELLRLLNGAAQVLLTMEE